MEYGVMTFDTMRIHPARQTIKVNVVQSQQKDVNNFLAWCSDNGKRPGRGSVLREFCKLVKGGKDEE